MLLLVFLTKFSEPSPAASRHPLPEGEGHPAGMSFSLWEKVPSPSGRRWREAPDEGFGCGFAALCLCVYFLTPSTRKRLYPLSYPGGLLSHTSPGGDRDGISLPRSGEEN